jgi:hypothetical protein
MSRTLSLSEFVSSTLNGSGNGTISVGPATPGHVWYPVSVSIYQTGSFPVVSGSNTPILSLYAGSGTTPNNLIDATYQVLGASSSMITGQVLYPGQLIYAVWQYGNPDASVTLNVYGTRKVP